jgi:triacylglycerol esterase/lipase EstA (alpha/beta hydrolase family)
MKHLGDKISLRGHPVYIVPALGYNIYSIPTSAKTLRSLIVHLFPRSGHVVPKVRHGAHAVRTFLEEKGLTSVVLVAHSKGGLIGKYLMAHHNTDERVKGMVAVASPFSGSAMAKLIPHDSFRELQKDSEIIKELEKNSDVNARIVSVIPEYDNHVWATRGSFLNGAENIEVPVHGHHKVLFSPRVVAAVLSAVERLCAKN